MRTCLLILCALIIPAASVNGQDMSPHFDPDNNGGWKLNEDVSDEFDGDAVNLNKWQVLGANGEYYGRWKGRAPSQYTSNNVTVEDGHMTITTKWDTEFKYWPELHQGVAYGKPPITTGCLVSKNKFKYGYMEMRCKAADGPVSSAFWTTGQDGEIDVFEHYGQKPGDVYSAQRYHSSFHDWRKGSPTMSKRIWTNDHQLDFRVADDFHVYGLQWTPDFIKIHVDGRLVNYITKAEIGDNWIANNPQVVWIDSELFPWEYPANKLQKSDFADGRKFVVDYCRIWTASKPGESESMDNLVSNPGFESGLQDWSGSAVISKEAQAGNGALKFDGGGTQEQLVDVKPNTTYVLSAWAKCPETNMKNIWTNCYLGVRDNGGEPKDTRFFMPEFQQKSLQFKTGPNTKFVKIILTNKPSNNKAVFDDVRLFESVGPDDR